MLRRELNQSPDDFLVAADASFATLHGFLSRSIGQVGYQALFARAVSMAREGQGGTLNRISAGSPPGPWLIGLDEAFKLHGQSATEQAVIRVLEEMIDLLARFVGLPLTTRLVRSAWPEANHEQDNSGDFEENDGPK